MRALIPKGSVYQVVGPPAFFRIAGMNYIPR